MTTSFQADQICPTPEDIFRIFTLVKPAKIKVIIIGQDPYYRHGYADGIAFSAHRSYHLPPPSLRNIFAELFSNYQVDHLNN